MLSGVAVGLSGAVGGLLADPVVIRKPADEDVSPGFLGFVVVFVLALVTILLIRSMVGHLRRLRYAPDPAPDPDPAARPAGERPDPTDAGRQV